MKNINKNSKTEYIESWDAGTYQTGNTTPPKSSSFLVAVLLMLVIFLGGIASALGLVNVRLLLALQEAQIEPTVSLQLQTGNEGNTTFVDDDEAPELPQIQAPMKLADPNIALAEEISDAVYTAQVNSASVTVSGSNGISGPGLVISDNGYILTYAHIVEQQDRIYVTLSDGNRRRAAFVGSDPLTDLAVIYVDACGLYSATFHDQAEGNRVWFLRDGNLGSGAVCREPVEFTLGNQTLALKQTSAATNQESGALWNSDCQVFGMVSPIIAQYLGDDGHDLAWVIPSGAIKQIVDHILCCGHVPGRPTLDVETETVTDLYRNYWHLPSGLRITDSDNPSLKEGDILVKLNGREMTASQDLYAILFSAQPGQTMDASVIRDGKLVPVTVTIFEDSCED